MGFARSCFRAKHQWRTPTGLLHLFCLPALLAMPSTASAFQFHTPHSDPIAPVLLGVTGILFVALLGRFGARKLGLPSVLGELGGNCSCVACMDAGEGREQKRKLYSTSCIAQTSLSAVPGITSSLPSSQLPINQSFLRL